MSWSYRGIDCHNAIYGVLGKYSPLRHAIPLVSGGVPTWLGDYVSFQVNLLIAQLPTNRTLTQEQPQK